MVHFLLPIWRLVCAELHLRKIPLSFFGKKDLADLTSSIMNDCAVLESSQSHFVAPLLGALLYTTLIALSVFFFEWRMALAALWVLSEGCVAEEGTQNELYQKEGIYSHRRDKLKIHKTRLSNTFYQEKFIKNKKIHDKLFL